MDNSGTQDIYDETPVKYCPKCYSLKIIYEEAADIEYCGECGCTDIAETDISSWEKMYQDRYGRKFIDKSQNRKRVLMYLLPFSQLKKVLFDLPACFSIIKNLYPKFPSGMSRKDAVMVFFDKVIKDNRIDELRAIIFKHLKSKSND